MVTGVSSEVLAVSSLATGASLTAVTVMVNTSFAVPPLPSSTVKVTEPDVVTPSAGVQVIVPVALLIVMPEGALLNDHVSVSLSASVATGL